MKRKPASGPRTFGRRYVVVWDAEVQRFHVTLGADSIGFHKTEEGARQLAEGHARQVTVTNGESAFSFKVESGDEKS